MKEIDKFETTNNSKHNQSEQIQTENTKHQTDSLDAYINEIILQKKKKFVPKPDKVFRNRNKNFEFDYEEDPYEPMYQEEEDL